MITSAVKQLVLKDLYLNRSLVMKYLLGGIFLALLFYTLGHNGFWRFSGRGLSLITLQVTVAAFSTHIILATVLREREQGALSFVLSLPISITDYTLAKIIANLTMFLFVWALLPLMVMFFIQEADGTAYSKIVFLIALFGELLIAFCITLAVAIFTNSLGWMIFTIAVSSVLYIKSFISIEVLESIGGASLLMIEIIIAALVIYTTVFLQKRKAELI